jgi:hypothetical protein
VSDSYYFIHESRRHGQLVIESHVEHEAGPEQDAARQVHARVNKCDGRRAEQREPGGRFPSKAVEIHLYVEINHVEINQCAILIHFKKVLTTQVIERMQLTLLPF